MDRLAHKFEVMRKHVPEPVPAQRRGAPRSASSPSELPTYAVRESCDQLKAEYKIEASYLRLKAYSVHRTHAGFHPSA